MYILTYTYLSYYLVPHTTPPRLGNCQQKCTAHNFLTSYAVCVSLWACWINPANLSGPCLGASRLNASGGNPKFRTRRDPTTHRWETDKGSIFSLSWGFCLSWTVIPQSYMCEVPWSSEGQPLVELDWSFPAYKDSLCCCLIILTRR